MTNFLIENTAITVVTFAGSFVQILRNNENQNANEGGTQHRGNRGKQRHFQRRQILVYKTI